MIKNIILDIGGVIFDDGYKNLAKVLKVKLEEGKEISKIVFGGDFKKCLLGQLKITTHTKNLKERYPELADKIEYVLSPENYNETYPIMKDTLKLIGKLKEQGYKIYLLSNIIEETFKHINNIIKFEKYFDGGAYSYQEGIAKPDNAFYETLVNKYNLVKEECIFFDDKTKNVEAGNSIGIKSVKFEIVEDIKNSL